MTPIVIRVRNLETKREQIYAYLESPVRIGRNAFNTLMLDCPYVSQWHGIIAFDERSTTYHEINSVNNALANGVPVIAGEPIALDRSTELRLGPLALRVSRERPPPHALARSRTRIQNAAVSELAARLGTKLDKPGETVPEQTVVWSTTQEQALSNTAEHTQLWRPPGAFTVKPGRDPEKTLMFVRPTSPPAMNDTQSGEIDLEVELDDDDLEDATSTWRHTPEREDELAPADALGELTPEQAALQSLQWLARFCAPEAAEPESVVELGRLTARVAKVLELSSRGLVALSRQSTQTHDNLDLPRMDEETPLTNPADEREVLQYLLDWRADGRERVEALERAYRQLMAHQAGVLMGLVEGARNLLQSVAPDSIERELTDEPPRIGTVRVPWRLWPLRSWARWRRLARRVAELQGDEDEFAGVLFGRRFLAVYNQLGGQRYRPSLPAPSPSTAPGVTPPALSGARTCAAE